MNSNNFHFIRFLAATLVIYGHSYPLTGRGNLDKLQEWSLGVFPTAHMGVCIFFTISGYLIAKSLHSSTTVTNYLWKRLLRLLPGLITACLVTVLIIGPIATELSLADYFNQRATYRYFKIIKLFPRYDDHLPGAFAALPSGSVNGSLWTLAYEFTCYLLLLVAFLVFRKWYKPTLLACFVVLWSTFLWWNPYLVNHPIVSLPVIHLNLSDLLNFGLYFAGGAVFYLYRDHIVYSWKNLFLLFSLLIVAYVLSSTLNFFSLDVIFWVRYLLIIYGILYFGLSKGPLNHFERMGDLSYGLYIYAYPVQQLIVHFAGSGISIFMMFLLSMLFTLPLAWASWNWIEKPSLGYKSFVR
jgi:peptidoglycan/LPS O-acetylase OafA/YrhL